MADNDVLNFSGPRFKEQTFPGSSMIERVRYDFLQQTLIVTFKTNGSVYSFFEVPEQYAMTLFTEPSVGTAFSRYIKGRYNFSKR